MTISVSLSLQTKIWQLPAGNQQLYNRWRCQNDIFEIVIYVDQHLCGQVSTSINVYVDRHLCKSASSLIRTNQWRIREDAPYQGQHKRKETSDVHVYATDGDDGILVVGALSTNHGARVETNKVQVGTCETMQARAHAQVARFVSTFSIVVSVD